MFWAKSEARYSMVGNRAGLGMTNERLRYLPFRMTATDQLRRRNHHNSRTWAILLEEESLKKFFSKQNVTRLKSRIHHQVRSLNKILFRNVIVTFFRAMMYETSQPYRINLLRREFRATWGTRFQPWVVSRPELVLLPSPFSFKIWFPSTETRRFLNSSHGETALVVQFIQFLLR